METAEVRKKMYSPSSSHKFPTYDNSQKNVEKKCFDQPIFGFQWIQNFGSIFKRCLEMKYVIILSNSLLHMHVKIIEKNLHFQ